MELGRFYAPTCRTRWLGDLTLGEKSIYCGMPLNVGEFRSSQE